MSALQLELALERRTVGTLRTVGTVLLEEPTSPTAPTSLSDRLRAFGLPITMPIHTHANRRLLVTLTARGALRVHLGYAVAPDAVIAAIARWARPRLPRAERRAAQRILTAFPVHEHVPPAQPPRQSSEEPRPGDERTLARLRELHRELNARHFDGRLGPVILVLSSRMRRRLGEFRLHGDGGQGEIRISRRHLRRDGWRAAEATLAHEMVHQWQAETGRKLAHDAGFRARCAAMGIDPGATRRLGNDLIRGA